MTILRITNQNFKKSSETLQIEYPKQSTTRNKFTELHFSFLDKTFDPLRRFRRFRGR